MGKTIKSFVFYDNLVAIKWEGSDEKYLSLSKLRLACPCAFCSGEKDVFGNQYGGENKELNNSNSYTVKKYVYVGLYGVRFYWADGHSDGIYPFSLLKDLCCE